MSRGRADHHDPTAEKGVRRALPDDLSPVLRTLSDRQRDIVVSYLAGNVTITELAERHGITRYKARTVLRGALSSMLHPSRGGNLILMLREEGFADAPVRSRVVTEILSNRTIPRCGHCGEMLPDDSGALQARLRRRVDPGGRPRKWCSSRCRQAAYNLRRRAARQSALGATPRAGTYSSNVTPYET